MVCAALCLLHPLIWRRPTHRIGGRAGARRLLRAAGMAFSLPPRYPPPSFGGRWLGRPLAAPVGGARPWASPCGGTPRASRLAVSLFPPPSPFSFFFTGLFVFTSYCQHHSPLLPGYSPARWLGLSVLTCSVHMFYNPARCIPYRHGSFTCTEEGFFFMAKLKAPLMSLGASGQLGKAIVFFPWKGLDVVREYVEPANPQTSGQVTQRGYLAAAVTAIHGAQASPASPLVADDVTAYALWASVVQSATTWFNQAVRNWVDQLIAGLGGNLYTAGGTTPGAGQLAVTIFNMNISSTAGNFWYGTSKTALVNSWAAGVAGQVCTATITGLTAGTKYYWQYRPTAPASCVGTRSGIYYGTPT